MERWLSAGILLIVGAVALVAILLSTQGGENRAGAAFGGEERMDPSQYLRGEITVEPNPCVRDETTDACDVTVSWQTEGPVRAMVQVWMGGKQWRGLFACVQSNEKFAKKTSDGKISENGKTFWLYAARDCTEEGRGPLLDSVEAASVPPEEPPSDPPIDPPTGPPGDDEEAPNIIFIFVDDMGYHLLPYLEKLDRLMGREGTTFENFIIPHSVCCPSRASVLRGQYAHNHQVTEVTNYVDSAFQSFYERGHQESTVATWLKEEGYTTMLAGKYLNSYGAKFHYPDGSEKNGWQYALEVPLGWDEWYAGAVDIYGGYDFTAIENGQPVRYDGGNRIHFSDYIAEKAVAFIESNDEPFFLHLSPTAPHTPSTPAERHEGLMAGLTMLRSPSWNEQDVSDKPAWVAAWPLIDSEMSRQVDEEYRLMVLSMKSVEDLVEDVIEALDRTGKLENTYLFFTSDNGYHQGEHRLFGDTKPDGSRWAGGKRTCYQEDIRVPLIVRGPDVPRGVVRDELVSNIDLGPTWAEMAGASTPSFVDGRSFAPMLDGSAMPWRERILLEHLNTRGSGWNLPTTYGVLDDRYKYLESVTGETEFYDLQADPYELESRHDDPAYAPVLQRMRQQLVALRECAGDSCRLAEN